MQSRPSAAARRPSSSWAPASRDLSLAYNLATRGERDVVVLDAGYFQGGASGRNGTLIRGSFMSDEWTALFALANQRWIELSKRLGRNVMFSKRGYLLIAEAPGTAARFDMALATHRRYGVRSCRVSRRELAGLAPALDAAKVEDAVYLADGGVAPRLTTPPCAHISTPAPPSA